MRVLSLFYLLVPFGALTADEVIPDNDGQENPNNAVMYECAPHKDDAHMQVQDTAQFDEEALRAQAGEQDELPRADERPTQRTPDKHGDDGLPTGTRQGRQDEYYYEYEYEYVTVEDSQESQDQSRMKIIEDESYEYTQEQNDTTTNEESQNVGSEDYADEDTQESQDVPYYLDNEGELSEALPKSVVVKGPKSVVVKGPGKKLHRTTKGKPLGKTPRRKPIRTTKRKPHPTKKLRTTTKSVSTRMTWSLEKELEKIIKDVLPTKKKRITTKRKRTSGKNKKKRTNRKKNKKHNKIKKKKRKTTKPTKKKTTTSRLIIVPPLPVVTFNFKDIIAAILNGSHTLDKPVIHPHKMDEVSEMNASASYIAEKMKHFAEFLKGLNMTDPKTHDEPVPKIILMNSFRDGSNLSASNQDEKTAMLNTFSSMYQKIIKGFDLDGTKYSEEEVQQYQAVPSDEDTAHYKAVWNSVYVPPDEAAQNTGRNAPNAGNMPQYKAVWHAGDIPKYEAIKKTDVHKNTGGVTQNKAVPNTKNIPQYEENVPNAQYDDENVPNAEAQPQRRKKSSKADKIKKKSVRVWSFN